MNELSEHLGGHLDRTHVDRGVLDLITTKYSIASMIDIGCGPGGMYSIAKDCGIDWRGIDGDYTLTYSEEMKPLVTIHDFVEPYIPQHITDSQFDLAFSVEFLEHVEERYVPNFMKVFKRARYAVVTAAPPGAGGHHHVNCRLEDYWIGVFAANGFKYNHKMSIEMRKCSTMAKGFMARTGMFFERHS